MPLSDDPKIRARQMANLRPGAGAWKEGATPHLKHGLRSRRPAQVLLRGTQDEIVDEIALQVPLRGPDGKVLPNFVAAIESVALQLIIVRRVLGFLLTHDFVDERGRMRPEVQGLERANARFLAGLRELGATPSSYTRMVSDVAQVPDVARRWAAQADVELGGTASAGDVIEGGEAHA